MLRPTNYTPELAASICTKLAEGRSLHSICKVEAMLVASTVLNWLEEQEPFREQYARAGMAKKKLLACLKARK
jgi:hypothetical protein